MCYIDFLRWELCPVLNWGFFIGWNYFRAHVKASLSIWVFQRDFHMCLELFRRVRFEILFLNGFLVSGSTLYVDKKVWKIDLQNLCVYKQWRDEIRLKYVRVNEEQLTSAQLLCTDGMFLGDFRITVKLKLSWILEQHRNWTNKQPANVGTLL